MKLPTTWTTIEKEVIQIKDMDEQHIKNCIMLLERRGFISIETLRFYLSTSGPTGDMASYYFDQEQKAILEAPVSPWIDAFELELKKRKMINEKFKEVVSKNILNLKKDMRP